VRCWTSNWRRQTINRKSKCEPRTTGNAYGKMVLHDGALQFESCLACYNQLCVLLLRLMRVDLASTLSYLTASVSITRYTLIIVHVYPAFVPSPYLLPWWSNSDHGEYTLLGGGVVAVIKLQYNLIIRSYIARALLVCYNSRLPWPAGTTLLAQVIYNIYWEPLGAGTILRVALAVSWSPVYISLLCPHHKYP